jgi:hypothetical protein
MEALLEGHAERLLGDVWVWRTLHSELLCSRWSSFTATGGFVKQVWHCGMWTAETRAYRDWIPALGEHAPRLHSADHERCIKVLLAVAGDRAPAATRIRIARPTQSSSVQFVIVCF